MSIRRALSAGILLVVGCSPQGSATSVPSSETSLPQTGVVVAPTSATTPAPAGEASNEDRSISAGEEADARETIEALVEAYNTSDDLDAARYFARPLRAQCGGDDGMARALGRFRSRDRLKYEVQGVRISSVDPSTGLLTVSTSFVTFTDSGDVIGDNQVATIRLAVDDTSPRGWALADGFPPGVEDDCSTNSS